MKMQKFFSLILIIFLTVTFLSAGLNYNDLPDKVTLTFGINVRDLPSSKGKIVGTVTKGDTVEVLDVFGDYYKLTGTRKGKEKSGWMWQKLIVKSDTGTFTTTGGSLRAGPSSKNDRIGTITKGDINVLDLKITWVKIKIKTGVGWIYISAV